MSGRPRQFDSEAVLDAAMTAFWFNGYEGTSAQDLVDSTGLGRGSLYGAFGSKQSLYHETLRRYQDISLKAQTELLSRPGTAKERLRRLMLAGIEDDLVLHSDRAGCMALLSWIERAVKDPEVENISRSYILGLEKVLTQLFSEAEQRGEISKGATPRSSARAFMSSYFGVRLMGRSMRQRAFLEDVVEGTIARL